MATSTETQQLYSSIKTDKETKSAIVKKVAKYLNVSERTVWNHLKLVK